MSDWCLLGIQRVSGGYTEGAWKVCLESVKILDQNSLKPKFFGTHNLFGQNFLKLVVPPNPKLDR